MSTDLQLPHELPKLQISTAKANIPCDRAAATHIKAEHGDDGGGGGGDGDDETYRTPTSKESRIPEILTCPPAPRKPKPASCKRKLMNEYQFTEVGNKEEMDTFFRSTFPKRSCRCT